MIIEVMGRPPEHIIDSLKTLTDRLSKEKGVSVKKISIREAVAIKDARDLYSSFAEIELEFDSLTTCLGIVFAYMPSNLEIISPEQFKLKNEDVNGIVNTLAARLHEYDAIAKKLVADRQALMKKIQELQGTVPQEKKEDTKPAKKKRT